MEININGIVVIGPEELLNRIKQEDEWVKQLTKMDFKPYKGPDPKLSKLTELIRNTKMEVDFFKKPLLNSDWCYCECPYFKQLWALESASTSYMVRFLCNSCMYIPDKTIAPTIIIRDYHDEWKKATIEISTENCIPIEKRRVIMGFGPSGCGKSTIAKAMFNCLKLGVVWTIDGGISRENSIAWNVASKFKTSNCKGISNLYKMFKRIADSKNEVLFFIEKHAKISIYVPDTASGQYLGHQFNMATAINMKQYEKIDETWMAMLIWQHINDSCNFSENYKCNGCDKSGFARALTEGKKYDTSAYQTSMDVGYKTLMACKGPKMMIHNSGLANHKSIVATDTLSLFNCIQSNNPFQIGNLTLDITSLLFSPFPKSLGECKSLMIKETNDSKEKRMTILDIGKTVTQSMNRGGRLTRKRRKRKN